MPGAFGRVVIVEPADFATQAGPPARGRRSTILKGLLVVLALVALALLVSPIGPAGAEDDAGSDSGPPAVVCNPNANNNSGGDSGSSESE